MLKSLLILILISFFFSKSEFVDNTAQVPDIIKFKGKEFALNSTPLELYFEKFPEKRPTSDVMSTANWRGYIATFEISENELRIADIEIIINDKSDPSNTYKQKSVFRDLFPKNSETKLDWYNGILILPYGKLRNYVHMGFASTYSKYWLLEIKNGVLTESRNYNYKKFVQFKKRQFDKFKKTQAYKELIESLKKDDPNYDDYLFESFLKDFVINYTSEFLDD